MRTSKRKILVLRFLVEAPPEEHVVEIEGIEFTFNVHNIGWEFKTAEAMIDRFDGHVDAIAIVGAAASASVGKTEVAHPAAKALIQRIKKSDVYTTDRMRKLFMDWTIRRVLKEQPHFFTSKKVLFHGAIFNPLVNLVEEEGGTVWAADALSIFKVPKLIKSKVELERYLKVSKLYVENAPATMIHAFDRKKHPMLREVLRSWIKKCDIFVTFEGLIGQIGDLDVLSGKTLITEPLSETNRAKLPMFGLSKLLEIVPEIPELKTSMLQNFAVVDAVIDQCRIAQDSPLRFSDYCLEFIARENISPRKVEVIGPVVERCGFVVHPLSQGDVFRLPGIRWVKGAPSVTRSLFEKAFSLAPSFHYGQVADIKSVANGKQVICEVFSLGSTPKIMMNQDLQKTYDKIISATNQAKKYGCSMIGLGAYTKVIGDSGITVAKHSPIPVTNGNSYSAAATLWAAKIMSERLGFIMPNPETGRLKARAMVIGATGSIGRVSAFLLSQYYDELVLVATKPDKLIDLRAEIAEVAPDVMVNVSTNTDRDIAMTDVIVTATSNMDGKILDILKVKPGAVICDCSRPLDIGKEDAEQRPDVMVIESGEINLPGAVSFDCDIGLPKPSVYACLAETVLLTLEGRFENFSLGRNLSMHKVREIYKLGKKHGAQLAAIRGPFGVITIEQIESCRKIALSRMQHSNGSQE